MGGRQHAPAWSAAFGCLTNGGGDGCEIDSACREDFFIICRTERQGPSGAASAPAILDTLPGPVPRCGDDVSSVLFGSGGGSGSHLQIWEAEPAPCRHSATIVDCVAATAADPAATSAAPAFIGAAADTATFFVVVTGEHPAPRSPTAAGGGDHVHLGHHIVPVVFKLGVLGEFGLVADGSTTGFPPRRHRGVRGPRAIGTGPRCVPWDSAVMALFAAAAAATATATVAVVAVLATAVLTADVAVMAAAHADALTVVGCVVEVGV
mmetsp:Transcript_15083/g.37055  ORF Transcript_15083/g.37055 Transcript_15083/m.37055 type:complete len:265 (+) Transcript_15083:1101-1895(+)